MILQVFAFVLSLVLKPSSAGQMEPEIVSKYFCSVFGRNEEHIFRDNEIIPILTAVVVGDCSHRTKSIQRQFLYHI